MQNVSRIQEQVYQMEMSQNNIVTISALQDAAQAGKANLQARAPFCGNIYPPVFPLSGGGFA